MTESRPTNPQDFLAELLGGGQSLIQGGPGRQELTTQARDIGKRGEDFLIDKLGMDDTPESRAQIRQQAKYAGIAGALALMLKSRSARKLATLGGLAALGTIAYKGHQRGAMPKDFKDAIGLLTGKAAEDRSAVLIRAMVAAAQADGVITNRERELIETYPGADLDAVRDILAVPADPDTVAAMADSPQAAAEIFAVSCRVAEGTNPPERDYLDRLAMALGLDPAAAAQIETDVRTG